MKAKPFFFMSLLLASCSSAVSGEPPALPAPPPAAATYYIDAAGGDDANSGLAATCAWRTLGHQQLRRLKAGDRVLLKRGGTYYGQLELSGKGTAAQPVSIGSYGTGGLPAVVGTDTSMYAVRVYNSDYLTLSDIEIVNQGSRRLAGRTGLKIQCSDYGLSRNIRIKGVTVRDVNGSLVKEQGGGSGILIVNEGKAVGSRFDSLLIDSCHILRCSRNAIIWRGYYNRHDWLPNTNTVIRNNLIEEVPGDGIVPIGCENTLIEYNVMRNCPDILPPTEAAAGIWPWSCDDTVIQFNEVSDHKAPWDAQGYDCDYNCRNTVIQYNYSHDNYGGMVLICDNGGERNYSIGNQKSTVRYNISIGDGIRPKPTRQGMFSPQVHIAGRVEQALVEYNIVHSNPKPGDSIDRTMICSDNWGGYADGTTIRRNVFYTAEPSRFDMTQSTRNRFEHNWYLGAYTQLPDDAERQTESSVYRQRVLDADAAGYRPLRLLMKPRMLYGRLVYAVDGHSIRSFFSDMER